MLVSMAWRNLARNLRRSLLTGAAVAVGLTLTVWMRGLQDGSYDQMIDQVVRTRLGHLEVHGEGYLARPDPRIVLRSADEIARAIGRLPGVRAVSPRAISDGLAARDNQSSAVEVLGVDPVLEARGSIVDERVLAGGEAEAWCRAELAKARELFGGDEGLFGRWCAASRSGRYLRAGDDRAVVLGAGLAKGLIVSVGDDVTLQVVRVAGDRAPGGAQRGELSQRRLEVVGIVRTGNPETDDRMAFVPLPTLSRMLGTSGPNEIAVTLEDSARIEAARARVARIASAAGAQVHTWYERNPQLRAAIESDSKSGNVMYLVLFLLVALGVVNTTFMSVLERTRELGIMLALGMRRARLFWLVMTEVALLGIVSVAAGSVLAAGFEIFGRTVGWHLEWFMGESDFSELTLAGVAYDPVYYSGLRPLHGLIILCGVYLMFLAAGIVPALRASRLEPVPAMRQK